MTDQLVSLRVFCHACRLLLSKVGEPRPDGPCPRCGDSETAAFPPGQEFALIGDISLISRPKDGGRWGCKSQLKNSVFRANGKLHFITRVIDRWSNRYRERIVEVGTGAVVRGVDELLTDHVGRGSAKPKKKTPDA